MAPEFNQEKFNEVTHYVIDKSCHLGNFGMTVLYKLLYFSDFDFYELTEKKMTGESYRKLPKGPAPCHIDAAIKKLKDEGKIKGPIQVQYGGYLQKRFSSTAKPDLKLLSAKELEVIDKVLQRYSGMNASQISAMSHADMPYKAAKDKEIIDYELVFYRDPMLSVREYEND